MRIVTTRKYKKHTDEISDVASVLNLYASKIIQNLKTSLKSKFV